MADRIMSDAEIKRRKKAQGHISQTTGALGLAALGTRMGAKGPAKLAAKGSKLGVKLKPLTEAKMKDASNTLATTGAGIAGAGSFNFASYTNAESRKRTPVTKNLGTTHDMDPVHGEIAKAWAPSASTANPEAQRAKRNQQSAVGLGAASAGMGAGVAARGAKGGSLMPKVGPKMKSMGAKVVNNPVGQAMKKSPLLTAGAAATGVGALAMNRKQKNPGSWSSYSKSDQSAFGISHH